MDLDTVLLRYFGTAELDALSPAARAAGEEQLLIDFAVETVPDRRFALWVLMAGLGIAPVPAEAFDDARLRRAAEDYLSAAWRLERDAGNADLD